MYGYEIYFAESVVEEIEETASAASSYGNIIDAIAGIGDDEDDAKMLGVYDELDMEGDEI